MRDPAFDAEMLPHLRAVFDFALRLTSCASTAEDLTQETYLRAFAAFDKFALGTSARAWLFTILRNCHRNRLRHDSRHPSEALDDDLAEPAQQEIEPHAWDEITAEELDAALAALPLRHREILVLRELQHLSYKDIAVVLSCPVGTVMSRLHRARIELRRALEPRLAIARTPQRRGAL